MGNFLYIAKVLNSLYGQEEYFREGNRYSKEGAV